MDEQQYRSTYHSINELQCVFEKAVLSRRSHCSRCTRFHLADREGAACNSEPGHGWCADLLDHLRRNAIFSLKITQIDGQLPHGKEIKVQNGGLLGLQKALMPELEAGEVEDIFELVNQARIRFGDLDRLPYSEIVQSIVTFQARTRRKPRQR